MHVDNTPPASSRYTRFFDQNTALAVTTSGQLQLLMVIERLAAAGINVEPQEKPE